MKMRQALLAVLTLASLPGPAQTEPSGGDIQQIAEKLIPTYAGKAEPADLATLLQLQLAAGRYAEAEATIGRLEPIYRARGLLRPARSLTGWRLYAWARQRAARGGLGMDRALAEAFGELIAPLPDKEAADVTARLRINLDRARRDLASAESRCAGQRLEACPAAADVVKARFFLDSWSLMAPRLPALIRADAEKRYIIEDDRLVPTPDGARIDTLIVRPRTTAPVTALMEFSIYVDVDPFAGEAFSFDAAAKMAANGYAGVISFSRGKGKSPGPRMPHDHDGADAAAVIDWLAAQPWSDGRVGMFSGSYNGFTQWAAAKRMPRALKALATHATHAPGIDTPMERNIFYNFIYPWPLYVTNKPISDEPFYSDPERWAALNRNWYVSGRSYRDLERIDGTPNPIFAKWLDHPGYDSYWRGLIPQKAEYRRIDIPVLAITGYFDGGQVGALHYFREHHKYNPEADHRLLIGPYHHVAMNQGVLPNIAGYQIDEVARIDLQDLRLKWFDHVFRGAPLPGLLRDRVNFEVMGANEWRHVSSLEAMADERLRLHLGGAAGGDRFALGPAKRASGAPLELRVDFADRRDADYQPPADIFSRDLDTRNALVFETEPFSQAIEVNGTFSGRFDIVANKKDLDLSVALYEQLPDGGYFPLASFIGRASYFRDRNRRRLLRPGKSRSLSFESERMTSRKVAAGSRIVAVIGVLKQPDIQINYGTGRDVSDESIADAGEPLRLVWSRGSFLELAIRR
jgi:uncharacterized protein